MIIDQHVPLIEPGQNRRCNHPIEALHIIEEYLGQLHRREKGHPEMGAAEPLGIGGDHRRSARRSEPSDVAEIGARSHRPAEEGRS